MTSAKHVVDRICVEQGIRADLLVSKVSTGVAEARAANASRGLSGAVRCGRSWRGQRLEQMPYREDSIFLFASKGRGQFGNALSPFCLDVPAHLMCWATEDGEANGPPLQLTQKLELVWQAAKKMESESWSAYFARRGGIYKSKIPKRRYIEKTQIAGACFGSAADGLVQYVPSRVFYCTAYEQAVSQLPEFLALKSLVESGFNLLILGPDGHPLATEPGAMAAAYCDASLQFGHERVLVAMLRGERPWIKAKKCWRDAEQAPAQQSQEANGVGNQAKKRLANETWAQPLIQKALCRSQNAIDEALLISD